MNESSHSILESYKNDGFIYCITSNTIVNGKPVVKIGKTQGINKQFSRSRTIENSFYNDSLNHLIQRYSTYYVNLEVLYFIRVGNHHEAEKMLFDILKKYHIEREFFYFNKFAINIAFKSVEKKFKNIEDLIKKANYKQLTYLNYYIREILPPPKKRSRLDLINELNEIQESQESQKTHEENLQEFLYN
jgi:hypothetical protein